MPGFNFKKREEAEAAKAAARERLDGGTLRTIPGSSVSPDVRIDNFWMEADGEIPAGTIDEPSNGQGFLVRYFPVDEEWIRQQIGGQDMASFPVVNTGPTIKSGTRFRAFSDSYGVGWVDPQVKTIDVRLEVTNPGDKGSGTTTVAFTYNAFDHCTDEQLNDSPLSPDTNTHNRPTNLEMRPALSGVLLIAEDPPRLIRCNEMPADEECEEDTTTTGP